VSFYLTVVGPIFRSFTWCTYRCLALSGKRFAESVALSPWWSALCGRRMNLVEVQDWALAIGDPRLASVASSRSR